MTTNHPLTRSLLVLSALTALCLAVSVVHAAPTNFFWVNTNGGVWSEAANWTNEDATAVAPDSTGQSFYKLNFACGGTYAPSNDFPDGFQLNKLNYGAGNARLLGSMLTFTNDGANLPQVNHNGSVNLTVSNDFFFATNVTFAGTSGNRLYLYGVLSGPGGIIKNANHQLMIEPNTRLLPNSYAGGTVFNSGTLNVNGRGLNWFVAFGTGPVTVNGGTFAPGQQGVSNANVLTFNGGLFDNGNSFGTAWYGPVIVNTNLPIRVRGGIGFYGPISGPGGFVFTRIYSAAPTHTMYATNTYTGSTTVSEGCRVDYANLFSVPPGHMRINADLTNGLVRVLAAGTSYISALTLGGIAQPYGEYGAIGSAAPNQSIHFSNSVGTVTVTLLPFLDITNESPTIIHISQPSVAVAGTNNAYVVGDMWISNAANDSVSIFPATSAWTSATVPVTFIEVGETNLVYVYGTNDIGVVTSDNIMVISVPEPAAAAAATVIGYSLFVMRRKVNR